MSDSLLSILSARRGDGFAIADSGGAPLLAADVLLQAGKLAATIVATRCQRIALVADNGVPWILADLACQHARLPLVPLPLFFSDAQMRHAVRSSGVDLIIADKSPRSQALLDALSPTRPLAFKSGLRLYEVRPQAQAQIPPGTTKITFTSGTTGAPKGVCLSTGQQLKVAASLVDAVGIDAPRHLCLLPLSTLLENLAGVYAPLLAGGTVMALPLSVLGMSGSSGLNVGMLLACIERHAPETLMLVPELLAALTAAASAGWAPPDALRFVAVGGGKVSGTLLRRAHAAGLPVFEGYGLSECGSVVSLNTRRRHREGTVGQALPHAEVRIEDGEIVVTGASHLGYVGEPQSWGRSRVRTGDLGRLDEDGYLSVAGRRGNQIITSFGRNISPEWVESELLAGPLLRHAVVFGDAQPHCVALLAPRDESCTSWDIADWLREVNATLPDYARVERWYRLPEPLSEADGLATANGRPRRGAISRRYRQVLERMFESLQEARTA